MCGVETEMMRDFSNVSIVELAAIVAEHLENNDIQVVLVGGLAVEIYTENLYLTKDIDMVNTSNHSAAQLAQTLSLIGFTKRGRYYANETTDIVLEFPSAPLAVGDELVKTTSTKIIHGRRIPILKVEDVVKDRLAAYVHWRDHQSLVQAMAIILKHQLELQAFEEFVMREGSVKDKALFLEFYESMQDKVISDMHELEQALNKLILKRI